MCEITDRFIQFGIREGIKEGIKALIETCMEFGLSRTDTLLRLEDKFSLSRDSAESYMNQYWTPEP